jgi:hypothetical protein
MKIPQAKFDWSMFAGWMLVWTVFQAIAFLTGYFIAFGW